MTNILSDGTIFDGRKIYTVVEEEGYGFEKFVSGFQIYRIHAGQETAIEWAYRQNPDSTVWLRLLRTLPFDTFEPPYLVSETAMFFAQRLFEAGKIDTEETLQYVTIFWAKIYTENLVSHLWQNKWAIDFFAEHQNDLLANEILALAERQNTKKLASIYRNNPHASQWLPTLLSPKVTIYVNFFIAQLFYPKTDDTFTYEQFQEFANFSKAKIEARGADAMLFAYVDEWGWADKISKISKSDWDDRPELELEDQIVPPPPTITPPPWEAEMK
jgi:hypothetical protein